MPQPGQVQQIPSKVLTEYTISDPHFTPPLSAGVPAPIAAASTPSTYVLVSDDYNYTYTLTFSVAAGARLTIQQQIPLANIPPIIVPNGYLMDLHTIPWADSKIDGMVLQGVTSIGVVSVSGTQFQGESFGPGSYSAFAALVTVRVFNATAGAINSGQIVLWVHAQMEYLSGFTSSGA